jgi:O-antigen ligase
MTMRQELPRDSDHNARNIAWCVLLLLLAIVALTGGSYRPDIPGLLVLRPAAASALVVFLTLPVQRDWSLVRIPLLLLVAFAATMAVQLIPLPPSVWLAMPGHAQWSSSARLAGIAEPWRPVSLDPDLTLNSLLALLPSFAVLVGTTVIGAERRRMLLFVVLAIGFCSLLLGFTQFASGANDGFYLYRYTSRGLAVGLLANKNHQGVMLAMMLPLLAVAAFWPTPNPAHRRILVIAAIAYGVIVLPIVLASGSRAGLGLVVLGLLSVPVVINRFQKHQSRMLRLIPLLIVAVALALGAAAMFFHRAVAIDRLLSTESGRGMMRTESLPLSMQILWDYFPFGIGYGAFDPVFRTIEPDRLLAPTYFNRAHNDLLETVMSGGVLGGLILAAFLAWLAWAILHCWLAKDQNTTRADRLVDHRLALAGSVFIVGFLLASLVDYPLRAPLVAVLFTITICWVSAYINRSQRFPKKG